MNRIILIMLVLFTGFIAKAQSPAEAYSLKISLRMKDSLALTNTQRLQIYDRNMQLESQKKSVWQQYSNRDSVRVHLQRIENTRDSLYHVILPENKYLLYKEKKRWLLNNN